MNLVKGPSTFGAADPKGFFHFAGIGKRYGEYAANIKKLMAVVGEANGSGEYGNPPHVQCPIQLSMTLGLSGDLVSKKAPWKDITSSAGAALDNTENLS